MHSAENMIALTSRGFGRLLDLHLQKVPQHVVPMLGEKAFRMELQADDGKRLVTDRHDFGLAIRPIGPGGDVESSD